MDISLCETVDVRGLIAIQNLLFRDAQQLTSLLDEQNTLDTNRRVCIADVIIGI